MKAEANSTALAVVKPLSRRQRAYRMPHATNGRFQPVPKATPSEPIDWNAIYEWRDGWRAHLRQQEALKREERWAGLRSIMILTAMSTVLVGLLVAGTVG